MLQALDSASPPGAETAGGHSDAKLGEYRELIDDWLTADLGAPTSRVIPSEGSGSGCSASTTSSRGDDSP